ELVDMAFAVLERVASGLEAALKELLSLPAARVPILSRLYEMHISNKPPTLAELCCFVVSIGASAMYPDLFARSSDREKRFSLAAVPAQPTDGPHDVPLREYRDLSIAVASCQLVSFTLQCVIEGVRMFPPTSEQFDNPDVPFAQ